MNQPLFPFSLSYENNPILPVYQKAFFQELQFAWRKCIAFLGSPQDLIDIDETTLNPFLRIPEISANLLFFLDTAAKQEQLRKASEIIHLEAKRYITGGVEAMLSNAEKLIPGTNIRLGGSEYTTHISNLQAHPDHKMNEVSSLFGEVPEQEWLNLYEKSFALIKNIDMGFFVEMQEILTKIVPYGVSENVHNSCSHNNIIGIIYSSYPIGYNNPEFAILEALIHEYNHNKIHVIMRSDKLILNEKRTNYYSPYRPDARHIHGIYLGLHAMVAVYYIMLKCFEANLLPRESQFFRKTIVYVLKNQLSINTLTRYGKFTPLGTELFEDMKGVHGLCLDMIKSMKVDASLLQICKAITAEHFYTAKSSNKILFY